MTISETKRLKLDHLTTDDSDFIFRLLNSPGWIRFIGNRNVKNITDAENYIKNAAIKSYEINGFGLYSVRLKTSGIPVGICGLIKRDTLDDIDLGFALLPEHEGKGFAIEAAAAVLIHAVKDFKIKRVAAITDKDNLNSIKLLLKKGFKFEKFIQLNGEERELMYYSVNL